MLGVLLELSNSSKDTSVAIDMHIFSEDQIKNTFS